eukprot:2323729-Pyramimonas_sp.AAC.1
MRGDVTEHVAEYDGHIDSYRPYRMRAIGNPPDPLGVAFGNFTPIGREWTGGPTIGGCTMGPWTPNPRTN